MHIDQGEGEHNFAAVAVGAARSWPQHILSAATASSLFEYWVTSLIALLKFLILKYKGEYDHFQKQTLMNTDYDNFLSVYV